MAVQVTCPKCQGRMALSAAPQPGQKLQCPHCQHVFVIAARQPATQRPAPTTASGPAVPSKAAKAPATAAAATSAPAAAQPDKKPVRDEFDDASPYAVVEESEEEKKLAEANKPRFDAVKDRFKKSARGPAMSLLVLPSNLLIAEGGLTFLVGLSAIVIGLWPIVFSDAPPSDEEFVDLLQTILIGLFAVIYGSLICYGASQMQNLNSYAWGIAAGVLGILPLLAGIFALVTLRDPRVLAGFAEIEGSAVGEKDEDEEAAEDDEAEDEDDDD